MPRAAVKSSEEVAKSLMREPGKLKASLEAERMRRMETDNASLKAENTELKRALEKYAVLQEALSLTGRLPR